MTTYPDFDLKGVPTTLIVCNRCRAGYKRENFRGQIMGASADVHLCHLCRDQFKRFMQSTALHDASGPEKGSCDAGDVYVPRDVASMGVTPKADAERDPAPSKFWARIIWAIRTYIAIRRAP